MFFTSRVAAHEVPRDNLIQDLAEDYEFNAIHKEEDYEDEMMTDANTQRLRGSSFNKEGESTDADDVDWEKLACEARQRAAIWHQRMKNRSGQAYENAKRHYEEAKAASLRASAHISPWAKDAWERTKRASSSIANDAKAWFNRHLDDGDGSPEEFDWNYDGEDEFDFDVEC